MDKKYKEFSILIKDLYRNNTEIMDQYNIEDISRIVNGVNSGLKFRVEESRNK